MTLDDYNAKFEQDTKQGDECLITPVTKLYRL